MSEKPDAPSTVLTAPVEGVGAAVATDELPPIKYRHKVFADGWLLHGNRSKAARDAGYAATNAAQQAQKILARPEVQAYVAQRRVELADEFGLDVRELVRELRAIAHSDKRHYVARRRKGKNGLIDLELAEGAPSDAMKAVSEFDPTTGKYKLWPKMTALRTGLEVVEAIGRNQLPAPLRTAVGAAIVQGPAAGADAKPQTTRILVQIAVVAE